MTELFKYEKVNQCETPEELSKTIESFADANGMIQGRIRQFNAAKMAGYVNLVVNEEATARVLTREFGIRQQAIYLQYCKHHNI